MGGDILDWMMDHVMPWIFIVFIAVLVLGLPVLGYAYWQESKSPTFTLRKDSWSCSASHPVTTTTYVQTGKVLLPITSTHKECDQWTANP